MHALVEDSIHMVVQSPQVALEERGQIGIFVPRTRLLLTVGSNPSTQSFLETSKTFRWFFIE